MRAARTNFGCGGALLLDARGSYGCAAVHRDGGVRRLRFSALRREKPRDRPWIGPLNDDSCARDGTGGNGAGETIRSVEVT